MLAGHLIEILSAVLAPTQTMNFLVLDGKFVIIGDFFPDRDGLFGINDNLLFPVNCYHFSVTVWLKKIKVELKVR